MDALVIGFDRAAVLVSDALVRCGCTPVAVDAPPGPGEPGSRRPSIVVASADATGPGLAAFLDRMRSEGGGITPYTVVEVRDESDEALARARELAVDAILTRGWSGAALDLAVSAAARHVGELVALRKSEARFRTALEDSPVMLFTQDRGLKYTWVCHAPRGFLDGSMIGHSTADVLSRLEGERLAVIKRRVMDSGEPAQTEVRLEAGNEPRIFEATFRPLRDDDRTIIGIAGTVIDGTERERRAKAERTLDEVTTWKARYEAAIRASRQIFYDWDAILDHSTWSGDVQGLLGFRPEDLKTFDQWIGLVHPDERSGVKEAIDEAMATRVPYTLTYRLASISGEYVHVSDSGCFLCDASGVLLRAVGIVSDVTALRRAEEERAKLRDGVAHAQRLESLGVLAGGIAHDFNNLLMGVLGNADLALRELSPYAPTRPLVESIQTAAVRAADLTRQMLAYSGKGRFVVEPIDLNAMIEELAHLLQVAISKKVVLKFHLADSLPTIDGDVSQIRQVVMNLITNASEAIGDRSGLVAITTGVVHAADTSLTESIGQEKLAEGYYVFLEVSDTGVGMDEATRVRIFDPFFTTKFTGRGLGLAAVLGIVRGHRGALRVYSEPQKGTTFKVLFPVSTSPKQERTGSTADIDKWKSDALVLVVDDEVSVRSIVKRTLESVGMTVITASDGREGLATFRDRASEIDAVLLDMTMPHMGGEEAFREMRLVRPDVRVVLTSGYSEQDATNHFAGKGLAGFVQKPFGRATLLEALRVALRHSEP